MHEPSFQVDPEAFVSYLRAREWHPVATWRGTTVWERGPESDQLFVPEEPHSRSGKRLLARALYELAASEDRRADLVLADLAQPRADIQRFRLLPPTPSGSIPIAYGHKAISAIYEVLRDAGRNAFEGPRMYHRDKAAEPVNAFLNRVELGLTEPGSYIFTTRFSGADPARQESLFESMEPSSRLPSDHEVAIGLQSAVFRAHEVAKTLAENGSINNPSEQGISSNLCKALSDLSGDERRHAFEISFNSGFGDADLMASPALHFSSLMARKLHGFGNRLERLARTGKAVVKGKVIGLHLEDGTRRRRIQIKGTAYREEGPEEMSLWAFVSEDDYSRAIDAHRHAKGVSIEGDIVAENGGYRMHVGSSRLSIPDSD
ncbi:MULTISPECIES: hypothetical protein [Glycomyces]|uniref:Uncharacterized protein n=2 Tax=Glycomyces TaxID=58113 RepID=A0A9X3PPF2_9ACTN|nr:hypothetical protein [Glycomyces lechevalierae]MDA1387694.1 hypothetical protein [Glycomyces lechevalierae]MDR7338011.1 hypothetical protein [Glycomyces lechevalierae]